MGVKTGIAWTTSTFNYAWGCTRVSPACEHCYAESQAKRYGYKVWGVKAPRRFFGDAHWNEPRKWNAAAAITNDPWFVFTSSMADVFENRRDLDAPRMRLFKLIEETPKLTWLVLTKRYKEILELVPESWKKAWPINAWPGMTAENQEWADKRVPYLLQVPAARHFLSMEPLFSSVDLRGYIEPTMVDRTVGRLRRGMYPLSAPARHSRLDWCIIGGESGNGARAIGSDRTEPEAINLGAVRSIVAQCNDAGIDPFVKQLGEVWARANRKPLQKVDLHGGDITLWPADLRVQRRPLPVMAHA